MKRVQQSLKELLFITGLMFLFSCANIVTPSGGPSDRKPPVILKSEPPAWSSRFSGKKIIIRFDEFVTINDPATQIVISPPLKEMPEFRLRGKSVLVEFSDSLADSTTYTLYFGNSIQDVNESNVLQDYQYVFSTGNYVDSMSIHGTLLNAYTKAAEKGVYVMLYRHDIDSTPYRQAPDYLCKTNDAGLFEVNNIASGNYKIFALRDVNSNFLYDQPNEQIAFWDTLVEAQYVPVIKTDSATYKPGTKDSLQKKRNDSIRAAQPQVIVKMVNMLLFEEKDTTQKVLKAKSDKTARLDIVFRKPLISPDLRLLNRNYPPGWRTDEYNATRDTLICWLKTAEADTLKIEISDAGRVLDTVELIVKGKNAKPKPKNKSGKDDFNSENGFLLSCQAGCGGGLQDYYRPLMLTFNHPLLSCNTSAIILREKKDSVYTPVNTAIIFTDSVIKRKLSVTYSWKLKTAYELFIPPGAIKDIYGLENDTIKYKFSTTTPETYGKLILKMKFSDPKSPFVVQLVNETGLLITQQRVQSEGTLSQEHLLPGKYGIRAFADQNDNGKWDTGNYLLKRKPESVYYYPSAITIKANWDTDLKWEP